ncbi:GntR family transcriptional regulator [Jiangella aurantiaca]|uniref:GntR family transcriptional regulator n=1 Tax=Jiangella aurantiaca TaxID=2530373 RepID=A0A4R5AI96_9ACTN|nr:GntR family transcriptional regulator [Jiangella aurantiaca]TDD69832.1 GntR family transcriptional regulator [Jiangella aurantiaca]
MLPALTQPVSRTEQVRDTLRRAILDGQLAPGQPLVERELATRLGVSKTPVREALKLLHASGLVRISSYEAVTVRSVDAATVREVYQARLVLEPAAVRLAVGARGAVEHAAARAALKEAEEAMSRGDIAAMGLANRTFHRELYLASGNSFLNGFLDQVQDLSALVATAGWRHEPTYKEEAGQHADILAGYEAGDADRAEQLLRDHIERSFASVERAIASA